MKVLLFKYCDENTNKNFKKVLKGCILYNFNLNRYGGNWVNQLDVGGAIVFLFINSVMPESHIHYYYRPKYLLLYNGFKLIIGYIMKYGTDSNWEVVKCFYFGGSLFCTIASFMEQKVLFDSCSVKIL